MTKPSYTYAALLDRVVDGDTVDITLDLGFRVSTSQRVRLAGLNAPEHNTPAGQDAISYVRAWFAQHNPALVITSDKPGGGDKYGRFLATIRAGASCLNDDLMASGHAAPWDGQGAKPLPQGATP